ncbi:MAG: Hsp70 family protein [Balneola sp.]
MGSYIGIDLGTTFSAAAVIDETGRPIIVHNDDGQNITPSCVTEKNGTITVGEIALRTWGIDQTKAAARFKREMGTSNTFMVGENEFTPTDLSTFVLKKIVKDVSNSVGEISEAVITIPANFSNEAREATLSAAKAAGLNVKFIINEPTAAALYYAFKTGEELHGHYAVYDLGGGTFDISIIKVEGQDVEVVATNGVSKLGGDDFDKALIEIVAKKYKEQANEELQSGDYSFNDAENDKKSLSKREDIFIKVLREGIEITRKEFEEAISKYIAQTEMLCESTLEEANLSPEHIKGVLLAGGSTRVPLVRGSIRKIFRKEPEFSINVDEIVALGAALYCAYKSDKKNLNETQKNALNKIKVKDVTSKCFGTIAIGFDESREQERLENTILIEKGDSIPTSVNKSFFTRYDGQEKINCQITESSTPEIDPSFVKVIWEGELKLPAGRPQGQEIQITYTYDENQIMNCSFKDVSSGEETTVDLSLGSETNADISEIEKFLVE